MIIYKKILGIHILHYDLSICQNRIGFSDDARLQPVRSFSFHELSKFSRYAENSLIDLVIFFLNDTIKIYLLSSM